MNNSKALREWLELEAKGVPDERVEEALTAVFRALPVLDPGPAFTSRVVRATRWAPVGSRWFGMPVVRAAVALCVVQGALLLGMLPAVLASATSAVGVPGAVTALISTSLAGLRWLAEAASLSGTLGRTFASFASHPALIAIMVGCLLLSSGGLAALVRVRSSYLRAADAGGEP